MDILFEIVSRQKFAPDMQANFVFGQAGGIIGRGEECDWILPDITKQVSRKHAMITCYNGYFHIEDISTNGIFSSLGRERLPANTPVRINHGDGFIIGDYTVMARLMQQAGGYVGEGSDSRDLFEEKALSANPLEAMEQEAEREAAARLGEYNDILGKKIAPVAIPHDHSPAPVSYLPTIVPEIDPATPRQDHWNPRATLNQIGRGKTSAPESPPEPEPQILRETVVVPETDIFFELLGYKAPPDDPAERERILRTAAQILVASVEGITQAMQNRAECKNDLRMSMTTTNLAVSNNPLKFSPTAESALTTLLSPPQRGIMEPVESVKEAFRDNHSHHMGLLAGARAAVGAALHKISPDAVEARLDAKGPVKFARSRRLWATFMQMHYYQKNNHEGFEALFTQDFARAYEMQCRTLNPAAYRRQKGDI